MQWKSKERKRKLMRFCLGSFVCGIFNNDSAKIHCSIHKCIYYA